MKRTVLLRFGSLVVCLLAVGVFYGCVEQPATGPEASTADAAAPHSDREVTGAVADDTRTPLAAADLVPVIRPVGPETGPITKLALVFARPVVAPSHVGKQVGDETVLSIDPPVAGRLEFTDRSTLQFLADGSFAPGTTYEVELRSLGSAAGRLEPPQPGAWRHTFDTPPFRFLELALSSWDDERRRVSVDLVFSAAVDADAVRRNARFTVDAPANRGRFPADVRQAASPSPNTARLQVRGSELRPGARLHLALTPSDLGDGLRLERPVAATLPLAEGPELTIRTASLEESVTGFHVDVVCDDSAIEGQRWHWDRRSRQGFYVSSRCELAADEVAQAVRFSPSVSGVSVVPASGGFRILGDFDRGSYSLRVDAGSRSSVGSRLMRGFDFDFTVAARSPQLRFLSRGRYLPRSAWSSVPVRHLNVEEATLSVRHVPPENLVFWMGDDHSEQTTGRTSNLIAEAKVPMRGELDQEATSYLDLGNWAPADTRGLLEVTLASGSARTSARILLTDLLLVAKRSGVDPNDDNDWGDSVVVWALDSERLSPARSVQIRLVRRSGQELDSCRTGADGGCTLEIERQIDPSPPFAVIAQRAGDITYLKFSELKTDIQEARISGAPFREEGGYRAAVYSERGVYRPGETAHLSLLVRDESFRAPQAGMPVDLKLLDPRGKLLRQLTLETNAAGFAVADFDFQSFAATGRYTVRAEAAERPIGSTRFQVEEFVPERMRVGVRPEQPQYLQGQPLTTQVEARYLFGGVPAGQRVELVCELEPATFEPETNAEYHYGTWSPEERPQRPLPLGTAQGQLDVEGKLELACPANQGGGLRGPARLSARAAVAEAGSGRTSVGEGSAPVHPERFYLGLKSGAKRLDAGEQARVEGIVVDWEGRTLSDTLGDTLDERVAEVDLELVRLEWEWGLFYDEARGYESYRRYQRPVTETKQTIALDQGKFDTTLQTTRSAAGYLIRVRAGEARTDLYIEGDQSGYYYWSPSDSEANLTPRPGRPTWIAMAVPELLQVGDRFQVRFDSPFRGRALLTLESDELLDQQWLDVDGGEVTWWTRTREFVPNVYATVFVIKDPHLESAEAYLPDRAFGVASIPVEPEEFTARLALEAPAEVRSGSQLRLQLDLGERPRGAGPAYATVAAVDEGILSLTRFESPDPFAAIFPRRALGVETYETVGWTMMLPPVNPSSTAGGDRAGGLLGRPSPIEPVALWSGLLEIPENGKLDVDFYLPQYRGALRVMAVAADDGRMARAEAEVTVRDPLVLQTTLPRFLLGGDEVEIPAFVTNLSGSEQSVEVSLVAERVTVAGLASAVTGFDLGGPPPFEVQGPSTARLDLADGEGEAARFRIKANALAGAVRLEVEARAGSLVSRDEREVPLLPPGAKSRRIQRLALHELEDGADEGSDSLDLRPHLEGWYPLSERSTLWVTTNAFADVFEHLDHLIRYPYGCLEQTTSSTRPLIHLTRFLDVIRPEDTTRQEVDEMVQHGIDRLLSMQTPEGGFAYWAGGIEPARWASAYALHLLIDAQRLDYRVPQERIDEAIDWMERVLAGGGEQGDRYNENGEPYMHYVMALAGRGSRAHIERTLDRLGTPRTGAQAEARFQLLAALHLLGDHRWEGELKRLELERLDPERSYGWSFYSDRRRRGLMLSTLVDLFERDPALDPLAQLVADALRGRPSAYYTTQELVWGIAGLGKYAEVGARVSGAPGLVANGVDLVPETGEVEGNWTWKLDRASEYRQLELRSPEVSDGALYLILSSEGVPLVPDRRVGGEGLALRRWFRRSSGERFDPETEGLSLGELVHVELELENTSGERLTNLALVDRLPAGLEIENPRLGRGREVSWVNTDELWQADHVDVRDDRLEVFGGLERQEKRKVVYSARATAAGLFRLPGAMAEAMYNPAVWARTHEGGLGVTRGSAPQPAPSAVGGGR